MTRLIDQYDAEDALFYLDPPYLASTRVAPKCYTHELDNADHLRLLRRVQKLRGMAILSGYPSRLYAEMLPDWRVVSKKVACTSSPTTKRSGRNVKPQRTECLWINASAQARLQSVGRRWSSGQPAASASRFYGLLDSHAVVELRGIGRRIDTEHSEQLSE